VSSALGSDKKTFSPLSHDNQGALAMPIGTHLYEAPDTQRIAKCQQAVKYALESFAKAQ
jgi:hypothetical protein